MLNAKEPGDRLFLLVLILGVHFFEEVLWDFVSRSQLILKRR